MSNGRDMYVEGVVVPFEALEYAFSFKVGNVFTFSEMQRALVELGVDASLAYRASDRLLQQKRKAGLIKFSNKVWQRLSA